MIPDIKKILYVTDLSQNASYAFRYAVKSMQSYNARVIILTVVKSFSPVDAIPVAAQMGEEKYRKYKAQALKDGMRTLKQDGIEKIFMGLTDYEQLLRIIAE